MTPHPYDGTPNNGFCECGRQRQDPIHFTATFTAVLGVAGRPMFKNMLDSLKRNVGPGDQVIVVIDSHEWAPGREPLPKDEVKALVHSYGPQFEAYDYDSGYHHLGVEQMNWAFKNVELKGTHVLCLADDDIVVDGAFDTYREFCERDMTRPLQPRFVCPFGINFSNGEIDGGGRCLLWDKPRMACVRITGAIVVPKASLQLWPTDLDCCVDYTWMHNILSASPAPVWLDYVSIIARPDRDGRLLHQGVWICDVCNSKDAGIGWGFLEDGTRCACGAEGRTVARVVEGVAA